MKVLDIMHEVKVISPELTLKEAVEIMSKENIGSLVIISNGKLVGIITERDVLKNIKKLNSSVEKIMSKDVTTIEDTESIDRAAEIMADKKIKRLPVTREKKLVGIITATDILANSTEINENFLLD